MRRLRVHGGWWRASALLFLSAAIVIGCGGGGDVSGPDTTVSGDSSTSDATATSVTVVGDGAVESSAPTSSAVIAEPQDFSGRGPFAVGVIRLQLDTGAPVDVFYPADREAVTAEATGFAYTPEEVWGPLAAVFPPGLQPTTEVPDAWWNLPASDSGPFPIVVFSHGWGSERFFYSFHDAHLASWGFVVAAPEHVGRDLLTRLADGQTVLPPSDVDTITATLDLLRTENSTVGSTLEGTLDPGRVAVEGHSAGGRDAALAAMLPEVDTWIGLAGVPPVPDDAVAPGEVVDRFVVGFDLDTYLAGVAPPQKPSMVLVAENDIAVPVPFDRSVFAWLPAPKRFAELLNTGHMVFYDSCPGIQEDGGLQATADALGLDRSSPQIRVSENGCLPGDAPALDVAAAWNHLTVAQLDWVFEIDREVAAASLEEAFLDATFPGVIGDYEVEE